MLPVLLLGLTAYAIASIFDDTDNTESSNEKQFNESNSGKRSGGGDNATIDDPAKQNPLKDDENEYEITSENRSDCSGGRGRGKSRPASPHPDSGLNSEDVISSEINNQENESS